MDNNSSFIIQYVLFATPIAILIIASFRYLRKEKSGDSILLFSGSTLSFLSYTAYIFFYTYYIESVDFTINPDTENSINNMIFYSKLVTISLVTSVAGMFVFAFGFLIFWYVGLLVIWPIGLLVFWSFGLLVFWYCVFCSFGLLVF